MNNIIGHLFIYDYNTPITSTTPQDTWSQYGNMGALELALSNSDRFQQFNKLNSLQSNFLNFMPFYLLSSVIQANAPTTLVQSYEQFKVLKLW